MWTIVAGTYERLLLGIDAAVSSVSSASVDAPRADAVESNENNDDTSDMAANVALSMSIAYSPHIGAITCVAVSDNGLLATGSTDEVVRVYDVRRRKEVGSLHQHRGTITALEFHGTAHLFTASADGQIALYRTRDWELLHIFPSHVGAAASSSSSSSSSSRGKSAADSSKHGKSVKATHRKGGKATTRQLPAKKRVDEDGKPLPKRTRFHINDPDAAPAIPIVAIAVHPSGKLMVSLAEDRTLRLWDLARARPAFTTKLALPVADSSAATPTHNQALFMRLGAMLPLSVKWHPDGRRYAVLYEHAVQVFDSAQPAADSDGSAGTHQQQFFLDKPRLQRFHSMQFMGDWLITGCEDGVVRCYSLSTTADAGARDGKAASSSTLGVSFRAHDTRVKDLCLVDTAQGTFLVTAGSGGELRVWSISSASSAAEEESSLAAELCAVHKCGMRVTCASVYVPVASRPQLITAATEEE